MSRQGIHGLLLALAGCLPLSASVAGAAESLADYAGSVPVTTRGSEAIHKLELPLAVYAGVQHADLRDLRVFNAAQELVPYALMDDAPPAPAPSAVFTPPVFPILAEPGKTADQLDVRIEQRADGSVVSIRTRGAGGTGAAGARLAPGRQAAAYIVDATKLDSAIAAVTPQWRETPDSYIGSVHIEASEDLKFWRTVVAGAPLVYLRQGQARLVQDRIEFAATRSRYFRLVFSPAAPELAGLAAEAPSSRPEIRRLTLRVPGHAGANPGEFEFDLGLRAPVDRIRLIVPQSNTLAPVRLEIRPEPRGEWRPVVSTVAYRIVREGQELTSPAVPVPPNASPRWRAVVDQNSGGLGNVAPELEVSWPARNLVFLARGQGPYALAFGRRDALPVQLPPATLVPGYRDGAENGFPVADIGPLRTGPPPSPPLLPRFIGDADPQKLLLWAALILGVLILAGMAWRLSRQMKDGEGGAPAAPPEPAKE
jgi:Protein of unknown function (DUF3999)